MSSEFTDIHAVFFNADFSHGEQGGLNAAERARHAGAIVAGVECKEFDGRDAFPEAEWVVFHDTSTEDLAGNLLALRKDRVTVLDHGWEYGVHGVGSEPGVPGMMARHLLWADIEIDGLFRLRVIVVHFPPKRHWNLWPAMATAVNRLIAASPYPVLVGSDFNKLARAVRPALHLPTSMVGIVGWAHAAEITVSGVRTLDVGSDHPGVQISVAEVKKPEQPEEVGPMKFVSREAWGARPGATAHSHPIGDTLGVTFHWEGPHMGGFAHDRCPQLVRSIQRFHQITRGWADIAYNAVVCPHGYVFEGRGLWTRSAANGWAQVNDDWYAVCYLGGQGDPFTDEAKVAFEQARDWLVRNGGAGPRVNGHRDHKATSCPGDEIYRWLHGRTWGRPSDNPPTEEDEVTGKDIEAIVAALLAHKIEVPAKDGRPATQISVEQALRQASNAPLLVRARPDAEAIAEKVAAKVNALTAITPDGVKRAVKDALAEGVDG